MNKYSRINGLSLLSESKSESVFFEKNADNDVFTNKRFLFFNVAFCTEKMYFDALYFLCRIFVLSRYRLLINDN